MRRLADSHDGPPPIAITYETLGGRYVPRTLLAAGQGVKLVRFSARAYRIDMLDAPPIMIDSGLAAADAARYGFDPYRKDKQALVNAQLREAQFVVTLADDALHSGGLAMLGLEPLARKPDPEQPCPPPNALAHGLVEIPVCDRVRASRMIYLRLEDGSEYLLAGDIAPTLSSVSHLAAPSRLMDELVEDQDHKAIHGWLRAIAKLHTEAPDLMVISGHAPVPRKHMERGFPPAGNP